MKRRKKVVFIILGVLMLLYAGIVLSNQFGATFRDLDETDKNVLSELNTYYDNVQKEGKVWKDFDFLEQPVVAVRGRFGRAYLINPKNEIHSIFAKKIELPENYKITVYRISFVSPQLINMHGFKNFNSFGRTYKLCGETIFFTRYSEKSFLDLYDTNHYITFLAHESFHYYEPQRNWADSGRIYADLYTEDFLDNLENEYKILDQIHSAINSDSTTREELIRLSKEYLQAGKICQKNHEELVQMIRINETLEGVATYVGIQASRYAGCEQINILNGDYKQLQGKYFETVIKEIKAGNIDKSVLSSDIDYQSGALICQLLEKLEIPQWQEQLNRQTKEQLVTLYDVLEDVCVD